MDTTVGVRKTLFLCIVHEFGHSSITPAPLGFRSSEDRALNNTETILFGVCFAFLLSCYSAVLEAHQCTFWTLHNWFMETSLFVDNVWLWSQLNHGAAHIVLNYYVQRDANNAEIVIFTMSVDFVLFGHNAKECNMTAYGARNESVHILDKFYWCFMETSFLVYKGYSLFTDMRILVWRVPHSGTESTMKNGFLLARIMWWKKGDTIVQEEPLCTCFMNTTVHETELCTFWAILTFVSGKLSFIIIMHNFFHCSIT